MRAVWHARCLYFAASWGPWDNAGAIVGRSWDDPGILEGISKDFGGPGLDFIYFFVDLGAPF